MSLAAGTRLGPYEIVAPIGAGGMGEVYRARDTKLGREVAIKILPDLFAQDPERLARFEREARTLAALNHPNIAHLYGLEGDGSVPSAGEPRSLRALVMELVEGEDLAGRLARGPVPLIEVLPIARQLADAIEAAHDQGVIHRDLKPANIKVRGDGTVKVLDFGLAKALDPAATSGTAADAASNSPTFTGRATRLGMILGTAAYMAPEQARGKVVDRRADIWSFGVVLTELLTGERAFQGEDVSAVLAKVIERDPDFSNLPAATPPSLRRLLARCLVKDPRQRLRDIGEARIAIAEAERELAQGPSSGGAEATPTLLVAPALWRRALPWALAAGLLMTLVAVFARDRTSSTPPAVITRLQIALPPSVELYTFTGGSVCLSPDGSTVAFVGVGAGDGVRRVYQRRLDQFEITPVRGSDTATACAFSPDGRELLVGLTDSSLRRIRLSDGLIETVATSTTWFAGGAWLPNGQVVFTKDSRLWISGEAPGAAPTRLTDAQAGSTVAEVQPVVVPGGKAVLFVSARPEAPDSGRIEALSLTDKVRTTIVERGSSPVLTRTGHLLFLRDGVLLAAPFDAQSLKTTGDAMPVLDDLGVVGRATGAAVNMAVSGTGVLAYVSTTSVQSEIVSVSRTGEEQIVLSNQRPAANPRLSPDGRRILFEEIGAGLRVRDLERGTPARLAEGFPQASFPVFARDGRDVIFSVASGLFRQPIDGSAKPVQIAGSDANEYSNGMTPHDADVLFTKVTAATSGDVYALPLLGGKERALINTAAYEGGAQISPDGNWMVYVSNELGGGYEVFLQPYPALDHRMKVSSAGGIHPVWNPVWSPKGGEIFYRSGDKMMSVRLTVTAAGAATLGAPVELFSGRYAFGNGNTMANFSVTGDGQRFILVKQSGASLNVVLNWFETLKRVK